MTAFNDAHRGPGAADLPLHGVWANEKAKATPAGGWVSANKGLDIANLASPIDQLSAQILQDPEAVFRFDGSDQMPGEVGSGSFWKEMTAWITGESTAGRPRQTSRSRGRPPDRGLTNAPGRRAAPAGGRWALGAAPCGRHPSPRPVHRRRTHSPPVPRECPLSTSEKFVQMVICVALFFGIVALILLLTSRLRSRQGERIQSAAFVLPAIALIVLGLLYPAINTIYSSFKNNTGPSSSAWTTTTPSSPTPGS